jgi:hypothetical protein
MYIHSTSFSILLTGRVGVAEPRTAAEPCSVAEPCTVAEPHSISALLDSHVLTTQDNADIFGTTAGDTGFTAFPEAASIFADNSIVGLLNPHYLAGMCITWLF